MRFFADKGLGKIDQAISIDPSFGFAHFFKGVILQGEIKNDPAGAIPELRLFLASDPPAEYVRYGDFSSASGYREACELLALDEPPTAIVAGSDLMALAALQAIWESGRRPGRDVAVVGFDDLEAAALAHPPLTTVRQDRHELGTIAAECAIGLLERPETVLRTTVLPVELVVRASSSPA